jgi:uncharacterized YccA/Bax inhibitor family protein
MNAAVVLTVALIGAVPPMLTVLVTARRERRESRAARIQNAVDHGRVIGHLSALRTDVHELRSELGRHIADDHRTTADG